MSWAVEALARPSAVARRTNESAAKIPKTTPSTTTAVPRRRSRRGVETVAPGEDGDSAATIDPWPSGLGAALTAAAVPESPAAEVCTWLTSPPC